MAASRRSAGPPRLDCGPLLASCQTSQGPSLTTGSQFRRSVRFPGPHGPGSPRSSILCVLWPVPSRHLPRILRFPLRCAATRAGRPSEAGSLLATGHPTYATPHTLYDLHRGGKSCIKILRSSKIAACAASPPPAESALGIQPAQTVRPKQLPGAASETDPARRQSRCFPGPSLLVPERPGR
jgi:hypothetical protein